MTKFIIAMALICQLNMTHAQLFFEITAGNNQALIDILFNADNNNEMTEINIKDNPQGDNTFIFTTPYQNTDQALPPINSFVTFRGSNIRFERAENSPNFRLAKIEGDGELVFSPRLSYSFGVFNFKSDSDGGAITVVDNGKLTVDLTHFEDNSATGVGGAINITNLGRVYLRNSGIFESSSRTGAVAFSGNATGHLRNIKMAWNTSMYPGTSIYANTNNMNDPIIIEDSTISSAGVFLDSPFGKIKMYGNIIYTEGSDSMNSTDEIKFRNNLYFNSTFNKNNPVDKATCNDFGTAAFSSSGYNIASDDSCNLNQPTDLSNTNPGLNPPTEAGLVTLTKNSPAIDSGPIAMFANANGFDLLPCGFKDSRGMGRPQDANGDGIFECDRGSYEVQGGLDLTNAQSGLYFDIDRNGEGIIVEVLAGGRVLVTMFTYNPNKADLMWFIGVGQIVGNSIVIDQMQRTSGGIFGPEFDANDIVRSNVGSMSIIFPNCESAANPGRLVFQANNQFVDELENLLVKNNRLTSLINCDQTQDNPLTGRSGSFFDPDRDGEGIFIQMLNNGQVVVIFYTYTPDGKQFWFISSEAQVNGNTITADMVYPASTTGFGSEFNPDEIDLQPWGTLTIEYLPGCNLINIVYNSVVAGFGNGNLTYLRLTQPAGTSCDL